MTDIVKMKQDDIQIYPQTHVNAVVGLTTIKGDKGDKGDTGATGPAGAAATITVGTVTSGDTAAVSNAGTTTAAKFNFVLPKGPKGDTGATGPTGATGATGPQGPAGQNATTTAVATTTTNGLMSKTDKIKLDGLSNVTFEKVGEV
ncbi:collagen-like triple helix repeat-containing protein [Enterococcus dongliensis]|uniref:Collagen-like protein n=1 Tax=Enterococcus dongliensis TaxID=2559925 RepID=A0ABU3ESJ3_9ENTE|nr:collagen-like protein [Enterococcus dongliensis]MDT2597837.1 collagen-like protein [Enterococcus dongliensis]MDT2646458.1 collagen-like protein [Enterococcus dongliensis]